MSEPGAPLDEGRRRAFEAHRAAGGTDGVAAFAPEEGDPARDATIEELVLIDLELRWRAWAAGARRDEDMPSPADYGALFGSDRHAGARQRIEAECAALRSAVESPRELRPGTRLGRYELRERAGRGAFAEVWRASDPALRRDVAVKVLRADLAEDPTVRARFLREAQSAAALRHPGILAVHEVATAAGRTFLVAEFAAGGTLADRTRAGRLAPRDAAETVMRVAEALDYAHACGVVHRDVKPGNVLIDPSGGTPRVLLADFGLAALRSADATLTRAGEILGTPGYMAPEQVTPSRGEADARTDVYGLGATLYECLTGAPPFSGRSVESVFFAVLNETPEPPERVAADVPRDLATICAKAMSKDPRDRYPSARAMAEDLRRHLAGEPVAARPPGLARLAWMWARRRPSLAAAIVAGAAAVAASVAVGVSNVAAERRRTESQLYRSLVAQAEATLASKGTDWHGRTMRAVADAASRDVPERDARALRDLALRSFGAAAPSPRVVGRWEAAGGVPVAMAVSPDGSRVAVATREGRLVLRAAEGGAVVGEVELETEPVGVAFVGDRLVCRARDGFDLECRPIDLGGAERSGSSCGTMPRRQDTAHAAAGAVEVEGGDDGSIEVEHGGGGWGRPAHSGSVTALAVSRDGTLVASGGADRAIVVRTADGGEVLSRHAVSDPPRSLAFDASGGTLVWCAHETAGWGALSVRGDREPIVRSGVHLAAVRWIGFDGEGRVVTLSADATMRLWSADGAALGTTDPGPSPLVTAAVSPQGDTTYVADESGAITAWRFDVPSGCGRFVTRHAARFAPGTSRLATCAGVLDVAPGGRVSGGESPHADAAQVWGISASGDGSTLVTAAHDGAVRLRSATTFAVIRTLRDSGPLAWSAAISPDGARVAAACGDDLAIWDAASGRGPAAVRHPAAVSAAAFHPSEPAIVTACADGGVRVLDASHALRTLHELGAAAKDAAFSPDGGDLAVACADGTVRLWRGGRALGGSAAAPDDTLDAGGGAAWAVAFSPDGTYFAAGTERGTVTLFRRGGDGYRSVATFRSDIQRVRSLSFGGEGGRYLAAGCYVGGSAVWDLSALRAELRAAGLDW